MRPHFKLEGVETVHADSGSDDDTPQKNPQGSGNLRKTMTLLRFDKIHEDIEEKNPLAQYVPHVVCIKGREYIAVGFYDAAMNLCRDEEDIVGWAVALVLSGDLYKAIDILESFIETACVGIFKHHKNIKSASMDPETLPGPTPDEVTRVVKDVCEIASMQELHQWYLSAVMLHEDYEPTKKIWVRHFFSLFASHDVVQPTAGAQQKKRTKPKPKGKGGKHRKPAHHQNQQDAEARVIVPRTKQLTAEDVERMMIEQATEEEIIVVTAYVAFANKRFKTAIEACKLALEHLDERDICLRFIRACCALQVGMRQLACEDITFLMRSTILIVRGVGNALAGYAVPMPSALDAIKPDKFNAREEEFVYATGAWCHSLMLLQMGQFSAALKVAQVAAPLAPKHHLQTQLCDVACTASILLSDETIVPTLPLSPIRQLHLCLVSAFGGGFDKGGVASANDIVGDLLSVKYLSTFCDARQAMVIHTLRARSLYSFGKFEDAWEEICVAVEAADELLGSVEFAMSECAPHRVLQYGIKFGLDLLERIIEEGGDEDPEALDPVAFQKRQEDDAKGDAIIAMCKAWGQRLRSLAPKLIGGYCSLVNVMIAAHDTNSVEKAVTLTELFPQNVTALNLLSQALYQKHLIPDATSQAQRVLDQFPHVVEARANFNDITGEDGLYTYLYRGVLPITYTDGRRDRLGFRTIFMICLASIQILMFIATFVLNMGEWINIPGTMSEVHASTELPNPYGIYVGLVTCFFMILATFINRSLITISFKDLNIINTKMNRFLWSCRGLHVVNIANTCMIWFMGNKFNDIYWVYATLIFGGQWLMFLPFTTRHFFIRSLDEPQTPIPYWFALLLVDFITYLVMVIPHAILAILEPLFFFIYPIFMSKKKTKSDDDVVERIMKAGSKTPVMAQRQWDVTSGSNFLYLVLLRGLFWQTHSSRDTVHALKKQQQADDLRIFPIMKMAESIPTEPRKPATLFDVRTKGKNIVNGKELGINKSLRHTQLTGMTEAEVDEATREKIEEPSASPSPRRSLTRRASVANFIQRFEKSHSQRRHHEEEDGGKSTTERIKTFKTEANKFQQQNSRRGAMRKAKLDMFFTSNANENGTDMFSMGAGLKKKDAAASSFNLSNGSMDDKNATGGTKRRLSANIPQVDSEDDGLGSSTESWDLGASDDEGNGGSGQISANLSRHSSGVLRHRESKSSQQLEKDIDSALNTVGSMKDLRASMTRRKSFTHQLRERRASMRWAPSFNKTNGSQPPKPVSQTVSQANSQQNSLANSVSGQSDRASSRGNSPAMTNQTNNSFNVSGAASPNPKAEPGTFAQGFTFGSASPPDRRATIQPSEAPTTPEQTKKNDKAEVASLMKALVKPSTKSPSSGTPTPGTSNLMSPSFGNAVLSTGTTSGDTSRGASPARKIRGAAETSSGSLKNSGNNVTFATMDSDSDPNGTNNRRATITFVSPDEKNFSKHNQKAKEEQPPAATAEPAAPPPPVPVPPSRPKPATSRPQSNNSVTSDTSPRPPLANRSPSSSAPTRPAAAPKPTKKINLDESSDDDALLSDDDDSMEASQLRSPPVAKPTRSTTSQDRQSSEGRPNLQRRGSLQRTASGGFTNQSVQPKLPGNLQRAANKVVQAAAAGNVISKLPRRPESSDTASSMEGTNASPREQSMPTDRLRRVDSLPQTMREMIKRAEDARAGSLPKPVNGNIKIRRIMEELRQARAGHKASADEMSGGGDFSRIEFLRKTLENAKLKIVMDIERIGERISVESQDTKAAVRTQIEEMVAETDRHAGNAQVVSCLMRNIVTIDYASMIVQKNWLNKVIEDGSPAYLNAFLSLPEIATNLTFEMAKGMITSCVRHKHKKSSLMLVLTKCSVNCAVFGQQREKLEPLWQEAFEILCSNATFTENEDRAGRYEAIELLLLHPCIELDHTREARDKQTVFSRAAREGDLRLAQMLVQRKKVPDINRVQSDNTTALMQASARNQVSIVQFLVKMDGIGPSFKHVLPGKGSMIEIAVNMKRDPRIINILRERANELKISHKGEAAEEKKADETPSFLMSPEQLKAQEENDSKTAVDATSAIKILLATIKPLYEQVAQYEKNPTPTSEEAQHLRDLRDNVEQSKNNMVSKMARLGDHLQIKKPEVMETLVELLHRCIGETDRRPGNMELLAAVQKRIVGLDLAKLAVTKRWLVDCASSGSVAYMDFFSKLPAMSSHINATITKDCLTAAIKNKIDRIAVALNIVNNAKVHQIEGATLLLHPCWQQLFEDIASTQRVNTRENRQGRMELLKKMIRDPAITVDFAEESTSDYQTILSRAAAEGDSDLVALILRSKCSDPNRIQSDGTTALIQAIRGGHVSAVEEMIPFATAYGGDLNLNLETPQFGTAMDVIAGYPGRDDLLMLKARLIDAGARAGANSLGGGVPQYGRRSPNGGRRV